MSVFTRPGCWTSAARPSSPSPSKRAESTTKPASTSTPPAAYYREHGELTDFPTAMRSATKSFSPATATSSFPRRWKIPSTPSSRPAHQGPHRRRSRQRPDHAEADEILRDNGVTVLPDILANAGGVTVSYFEWVQGLQNFFWDAKQVQDELQTIMESAFGEVNAKADQADCDYRTAAYTIAISRVAEACRLKGLFP